MAAKPPGRPENGTKYILFYEMAARRSIWFFLNSKEE